MQKRKTGSEPSLAEKEVHLKEINFLNAEEKEIEAELDQKDKIKQKIEKLMAEGKLDSESVYHLSLELKGINSYLNNNTQVLKVYGPGSDKSKGITIEDLSGKSPHELKEMGIEEVCKTDVQVDGMGTVKSNTYINSREELDKLEEQLGLEGKIAEMRTPKEVRLDKVLAKQEQEDKKKAKTIATALFEGDYVDDPTYRDILYSSKDLIEIRMNKLRAHFRNEPDANQKAIKEMKKDRKTHIKQMKESIFPKPTKQEMETFRATKEYMQEFDLKVESQFNDEDEHLEEIIPTLKSRIPTSTEDLSQFTDESNDNDTYLAPGRFSGNKRNVPGRTASRYKK